MPLEENAFLDFLQLQGGEPELVTKSQLLAAVRKRGYSIGERQLTFYVSAELIPKSVRVGSRAGVYPRIVVDLLAWILRVKEGGVPLEAIRELLPIWKYLMQARRSKRLDLGELEYIGRQHVTSIEAAYQIPTVVADLMHVCPGCHEGADVVVILKDGSEQPMSDRSTTVGFAIARRADTESGETEATWVARTRLSLGDSGHIDTDPTTVILGLRPNEAIPADSPGPHGLGLGADKVELEQEVLGSTGN